MVSSPTQTVGLDLRTISCWEYGSIWLPPEESCEEEDFLTDGVSMVPLGELRVVSAWFGDATDVQLRKDITEEVRTEHQNAVERRGRVEIAAVARRWGDPATFRLKQLEITYEQQWLSPERHVVPVACRSGNAQELDQLTLHIQTRKTSLCCHVLGLDGVVEMSWPGWGASYSAVPAPGDMVLVPVMQLRFTHDKIRPVFRKGNHCGQPLYELVNDLFRGVVNPAVNLPPLEIYLHKGVWRSFNNRRLWALKAYMGLSGNFQLMVRACISTCSPGAFHDQNLTQTEGLSVQVEETLHQPPTPAPRFSPGAWVSSESRQQSEDAKESEDSQDLHLSAARHLLAQIYEKCCQRTVEMQRAISDPTEMEQMERCIGSLSQVMDAFGTDFPTEPSALNTTEGSLVEPNSSVSEQLIEVPPPPTTPLPQPPRDVHHVHHIPPPPAIPPPQPQDLDLKELLSGFGQPSPNASASHSSSSWATPGANSVAAQLFSMPAVLDHQQMLDDLRWPAPSPAAGSRHPRDQPRKDMAKVVKVESHGFLGPDVAPVADVAPVVKEPDSWSSAPSRWRSHRHTGMEAPTVSPVPGVVPARPAKVSKDLTMKEVLSRTRNDSSAAAKASLMKPKRPDPRDPRGLQADITGIVVKPLPSALSQADLLRALGEDGFDGQIDYCSLPEFQGSQGGRQAWLNFRQPSFAQALWRAWHGSRRFKHQEGNGLYVENGATLASKIVTWPSSCTGPVIVPA
eukprot:symbB.v1.2.012356.t1/scaffold854.1/size229663/10